MNKKIEYFLNAVHYCIYREEIWSMKKVDNGVLRIMHYLSVLFSFENFYNKKVDERKKDKALWDYMYGKDGGVSIGSAHHWFGYFYSCYPAFLSFILLGVVFRNFGKVSFLVVILTVAIPVGIFYIPTYQAVFSKDRYLKYFKQFEKKDKPWHQKWKRITILFCIGAIATVFLGIVAMWGVLLL